ncbi:unnamed protein product [Effrenium voratum]|nr:unnamed protein product [Effrenium voratum]
MNDVLSSVDWSASDLYDRIMETCGDEQKTLLRKVNRCFGFLVQHDFDEDEASACAAHLLDARRAWEARYSEARFRMLYEGNTRPHALSKVLVSVNAFLFEVDVVIQILYHLLAESDRLMEKKAVFGKPLLDDLFPEQQHLRKYVAGPLDAEARRHLIVSAKLTLAMLLATLYGFFLPLGEVNFLPAYTIAYIGVESTAGSNLTFSVMRCIGTLAAAIFAETVVLACVYVEDGLGELLLVTCALTLFMIPSVYVRSAPFVSYGGSTAAFTAGILLIDAPRGSEYMKMNIPARVYDTCVGAMIFILVELFVLPGTSQQLIFPRIKASLRTAASDVASFSHSLTHELSAKSSSDTASESDGESLEARADRVFLLQGLPTYAQRYGAASMQETLQNNSGMEPNLWRASVNPSLLQPILTQEPELLCNSLQLVRIQKYALGKDGLSDSKVFGAVSFKSPLLPAISSVLCDDIGRNLGLWVSRIEEVIDKLASEPFEDDSDTDLRGRDTIFYAAEDVATVKEALWRRFEVAIQEVQAAHPRKFPSNEEVKLAASVMLGISQLLDNLSNMKRPLILAESTLRIASTHRPTLFVAT